MPPTSGAEEPLHYTRLMQDADLLSRPWLRAGFVLCLVGYGTKMGLAPLHTWKPDAYGETPGIIGALLAGGVTSCAFLALLRIYGVVVAAGEARFAQELLVGFGMLSMAWAMVFLVRQMDFKRMLAYSSVEHMGILAFGIGIGGVAARFALFHLAANALVKAVLFMSAGNIHRSYASKRAAPGHRRHPAHAGVRLALPPGLPGHHRHCLPSPPSSASSTSLRPPWPGAPVAGVAFLVLLAGIFLAMSETVVQVVFGTPAAHRVRTPYSDTAATTAPPGAALAADRDLGLWLPATAGPA